MASKDSNTIEEISKKYLLLAKAVDFLNKKVNKSSKTFEEASDSFADHDEKIKFLSKQFEVLKNKIQNINSEYESFASKLVKPLNLAAISGTLGITSAISLAHDEVQRFSSLADSFRTMSNEFGNMGSAMSTMFYGMANSLASSETIKSTMSALHNTGLQVNETFAKLTAEIGTLDQITGIAADTWAGFHGEIVRSFGATISDVQELSSALIGTGLQGAELEKVIGTVKTSIEQVAYSAKDGVKSIKALTQSMSASISVFTKFGISAQKAGEFIGSIMNPEDFQKNYLMLANLGVSYEDYISSIETAEGKTKLLNKAMENLPQLAERISEIRDPFQRMNLAKNLGIPLEIVSKMAGKTKSEIRELMAIQMQKTAEKEALEKKKQQAKESKEKFEDALWLLKVKMLSPVMHFVSRNYDSFFKVLEENSASVARAFVAIFGVVQKLIPLLVKVSIFIGQNIAKAFEILVKPIGKLVDVILRILFPIINNIVIPVVEKLAKVLDWLATVLSKLVPVIVPFVAILGGLFVIEKLSTSFRNFLENFRNFKNASLHTFKESFSNLKKGNLKEATNSLLKKENLKEEVKKVELKEKNEILKGITHPLKGTLLQIKRTMLVLSQKALKFSTIAFDKILKAIYSLGKENRFKSAYYRDRKALLDLPIKNKKIGLKRESQRNLLKTEKSISKKSMEGNEEVEARVSPLDFTTAGIDIANVALASNSKVFSKFFSSLNLQKYLQPFLKFFNFFKTSNFLKISGALAKVTLVTSAVIGSVDGFVNANKLFNKELTANQEKQLQDFEERIKNGEQLTEEEKKQMDFLLSIKKKAMTENEKKELKELEEREKFGKLTAKEQLRLEELRKKELESQTTFGEKIAGGLSGLLSLGILPLLDSFFGTELQKRFAEVLLPIGNLIANFFQNFSPLVEVGTKIWNELLVQFRWAYANILAFFELYFLKPMKELWNSIINLFKTIYEAIFSFFNSSSIKNTMETFSKGLYFLWQTIKKILPALKLLLIPLDLLSGILKGLILGFKDFVDGLTQMIQKIKSGDLFSGILEGFKGLGTMVTRPFIEAIKGIFNRLKQLFKRTFDSIFLFLLDNKFVKKLGEMAGFNVDEMVEGLKKRQALWESTDKWTNTFDSAADAFWSAQTKAEKASILNKLLNSKVFENLMSANSALDEEQKASYRNMLEMMKKQLAEMKEARKEAKKTGGAIIDAIKKDEPPKEIKPEIKLRAFSLSRLAPSL